MTDNTENRIRLAEAMELYRNWNDKTRQAIIDNFDPFTDANDDYAVLEWMRGKYGIIAGYDKNACDTFLEHLPHQYRIGDYARTALKVLDK